MEIAEIAYAPLFGTATASHSALVQRVAEETLLRAREAADAPGMRSKRSARRTDLLKTIQQVRVCSECMCSISKEEVKDSYTFSVCHLHCMICKPRATRVTGCYT
jgi:hypothetical protein